MAISFRFKAALVTGFALFGAVAPMLAHHSFAAEYDATKTITVKGTVNHLSWVNPHAYVFVDVKDANGKVTTWAFESLSPNALSRQGWNRNSLKQGEEVTVEGYMAKDNKPLADGSIHANSRGITRADGRRVFVGTSAHDVPSK